MQLNNVKIISNIKSHFKTLNEFKLMLRSIYYKSHDIK